MEDFLKEQFLMELSRICMLPYYDKSKKEQYIDYKMKHRNTSWTDIITYVNIGLNKDFYENIQEVQNPDDITALVNKFRNLNEEYIPRDLETIDPDFNPDGLMLRHEARIAFEEMCNAAYRENIYLKAISTYRSFYYQWKVYLMKITPYDFIDEYRTERDKVSARPGHSEHQTGMAVDINDLEQTFENTVEGRWLSLNAWKFGFILRYPKGRESITGYDYEPWHFRYLGSDLAEAVYCSGLTYDEFYVRYLEGH